MISSRVLPLKLIVSSIQALACVFAAWKLALPLGKQLLRFKLPLLTETVQMGVVEGTGKPRQCFYYNCNSLLKIDKLQL